MAENRGALVTQGSEVPSSFAEAAVAGAGAGEDVDDRAAASLVVVMAYWAEPVVVGASLE